MSKEKEAYLWLILLIQLARAQNFRIYPLRQPRIHLRPRCPDTQAQRERMRNTEHRIPDDVPQERIQEEQTEIHEIHQRQRERSLVFAECRPKDLIRAVLDTHPHHDEDRVLEREREEEV